MVPDTGAAPRRWSRSRWTLRGPRTRSAPHRRSTHTPCGRTGCLRRVAPGAARLVSGRSKPGRPSPRTGSTRFRPRGRQPRGRPFRGAPCRASRNPEARWRRHGPGPWPPTSPPAPVPQAAVPTPGQPGAPEPGLRLRAPKARLRRRPPATNPHRVTLREEGRSPRSARCQSGATCRRTCCRTGGPRGLRQTNGHSCPASRDPPRIGARSSSPDTACDQAGSPRAGPAGRHGG